MFVAFSAQPDEQKRLWFLANQFFERTGEFYESWLIRLCLMEFLVLFSDDNHLILINVEHLKREEIEEAIAKPAEWVGLGIEGGLKQQLINDVEDYPGSLPLLQYTKKLREFDSPRLLSEGGKTTRRL